MRFRLFYHFEGCQPLESKQKKAPKKAAFQNKPSTEFHFATSPVKPLSTVQDIGRTENMCNQLQQYHTSHTSLDVDTSGSVE